MTSKDTKAAGFFRRFTPRQGLSQTADSIPTLLPARLFIPSAAVWLYLWAFAGFGLFTMGIDSLNAYFLVHQDGAVLAASGVFLLGLRFIKAPKHLPFSSVSFDGRAWLFAMLLFVVVVGAVGWPLVFAKHPLSMDEFWASFDAKIFQRGRLMAPIAPAWRPYVQALQPFWRFEVQRNSFWASLYLPVSAASRALFMTLSLEGFANPCWAALGCAMTFAAARKLWPQRRDAAFVAVLLLATSSQLLITAMTPYAMSAHFALNTLWFWLFLQKGPWRLPALLAVGFLATGLHQIIFHPLFVAPFILEAWIMRRWRTAAILTLGYAVIGLFWTFYWALILPVVGAAPVVKGGMGAAFLWTRVRAMVADFDPYGSLIMADNLLRFIAWQNPLLVPLALWGVVAAWRSPQALRPLMLGIVLTPTVMWLLLPHQGHGWGYRYLHGLLGSFALMAAAAWVRLTAPDGTPSIWRGGPLTMGLAAAFSLLVLLPWRAVQAEAFQRPYARAAAAIARSKADIVIVDPNGLMFGSDFIRNDPFLETGPKVMQLSELEPETLSALCRSKTIALFDAPQGLALGIQAIPNLSDAYDAQMRAMLREDPACRRAVQAGSARP